MSKGKHCPHCGGIQPIITTQQFELIGEYKTKDLFLRNKQGHYVLISEDLGPINDVVYELLGNVYSKESSKGKFYPYKTGHLDDGMAKFIPCGEE